MSLLRRSVALGFVAALALSAAPASAQMMSKQKEIRIDMLSVALEDGNTSFGVAFPGTLALGIYLNNNIAIEPQVSLNFFSADPISGGFFGAGVMVPYYFAGDMGKTGFFASPGLFLSKGFGDFETDMSMDYGADVGLKRAWKENLTQRLALTLRDGDSHAAMELGVTIGIAFHWK